MQDTIKAVRRMARRGLERAGLIGPVYHAIERRLARKAGPQPSAADGLALPSPHLMMLVAGSPDAASFLAHGRHIAGVITGLLARQGRSFEARATVLDFGCGCGRLARHLAPTVEAAGGRFLGVDINARLVEWCAAELPGVYQQNQLQPPAPVEAGSVDVLYSVSVFTHLPRESMRAWLEEFRRLLRPGGVALVSFADEGRIAPERLGELQADGFVTSTRALEGSNYLSSYVLSERFAALAAEALEVVKVVPSRSSGETLAWAVLRRAA